MQKFKIGDKVRIVDSSYLNKNRKIKYVGKFSTITDYDKSDNSYELDLPDGERWFNEFDLVLAPTEITWDTLEVGTILKDSDRDKVKVLAVLGLGVLTSCVNDFDSAGSWYTKTELQNYDWKIQQSNKAITVPLTLTIDGETKTYDQQEVKERLADLKEL